MDDELPTPGLSGWAGYMLGRMAANRDREMGETMDVLFRRRQPAINVNSILAQNQALAAENVQLRQELADYKLNYGNLEAWAERAEARINQLLQERG